GRGGVFFFDAQLKRAGQVRRNVFHALNPLRRPAAGQPDSAIARGWVVPIAIAIEYNISSLIVPILGPACNGGLPDP
ncbi:MAG TPA: hypothetical protein VF276_03245, partial [Chloroflexia bacterium]